ncbi:MAG: ABC-F family ATP-binding cassette domain-containing protein [Patescibacteria group bacterium]
MLRVEDVSYAVGDRQILDEVSFSLMPRDKVALVGENGAGKSTLLRIIIGDISAYEGSIIKPDLIGYVPQVITDEPAVQEGVTVLDFMLEGRGLNELSQKMRESAEAMSREQSEEDLKKVLEDYSHAQDDFVFRGGYEAESEIQLIFSGIGLVLELEAEVRKLSGGEKTRLAFARSIFADCDLLILDEPTNHIDRKYYNWLGNYLRQTSKTILVVSHHPEFINPFTQRIVEIEKFTGRAREYQGTYESYLEQSAINEKTLQRRLEWLEKEINRLDESARRLQYGGPNKANAAQNMFKRIERLKKQKGDLADSLFKSEGQLRFRLPVGQQANQVVIKALGLEKSFSRLLFRAVSFEVLRGDRVVIIGRNGSGKTTLLRIIIGLIQPDGGSVQLGSNVKLGYYAQEHENLDPAATVLSEAQAVCPKFAGNLRNVLARFLFFQDKVFQEVKTLSPGEKSRLSLCKLMLSGSNLVVLDEPTNYLDLASRNVVADAIQDYEGTVIFVSHDREFIKLVQPNKALVLPTGVMTGFEEKMLIE